MKGRLPLVALALVILALVVALVVSQRSGRRSDRELSGTIEAYEVQVASKVSSRVIGVPCEEGQTVRTGDTLILLDETDYRHSALAAQAQLQAARANLSAASSRTSLAETSLARMEQLYARGNLTRQEIDRTRTEASATRDALEAARTAVEAAQAQVNIAENRVADCAILAPIDGSITTLAFRTGEMVLQGSTPVTIVDLGQVWLNVYLPERLLGRVRLGDTCRVRVDAYPNKDFPGTLAFISEKAEFTPKDIQTREERINQVYRMKVTLPNSERILKPGMPADAYLSIH